MRRVMLTDIQFLYHIKQPDDIGIHFRRLESRHTCRNHVPAFINERTGIPVA